jgi:hypothetical protein
MYQCFRQRMGGAARRQGTVAQMVRLRGIGPKVPVSVRLEPRVPAWLKSKGEGHLTLSGPGLLRSAGPAGRCAPRYVLLPAGETGYGRISPGGTEWRAATAGSFTRAWFTVSRS